jgi:hypothetical protein
MAYGSPFNIPQADSGTQGGISAMAIAPPSKGENNVNRNHTDTVPRAGNSGQPESFPRRAARLLAKGPGGLTSPAARWTVNFLAAVGAVLLVWSGVIHIQLWSNGYRDISVIGPLFIIQGVGSIVIAVVIVVFRRLVLLAAGAVALAATAVGLLLSVYLGLFGYRESLAVPYAESSLVVEFTGAAVLLAAAAIVLAVRSRPRANP